MSGQLEGTSILVVEDEMMVLMTIESALEDLGCDAVYSAANVADALALLSTQVFDAAMLDVNLGKEKSYPVADALLQLGVPFFFSTGCSDHGARPDLASRPVLRKPYLQSALMSAFQQLLDRGAPRPAAA
jgi:CheY-like chemotaxis protein